MSNWYVGQKVVCVDDSLCWGHTPCALRKGHVYTINKIDLFRTTIGGGASLGLCELLSPASCGTWSDHRFRPIDALAEQFDRIESEGAPIEEPEPQFA